MSLHARNIAITEGAKDELVDLVAERMVKDQKVRVDRAKEIIEELTRKQKFFSFLPPNLKPPPIILPQASQGLDKSSITVSES